MQLAQRLVITFYLISPNLLQCAAQLEFLEVVHHVKGFQFGF